MSFRLTTYPHVVLDDEGKPRIDGTRMKVQHLAIAHTHHGWSAQELQWQFPGLTLAQIHSALAYYYDHQAELDRQAQEDATWIRQQGAQEDPALAVLLRQRKVSRASGL